MLIQKKIGHIDTFPTTDRSIDWLDLEWYETSKRILRKTTRSGKEFSLKFINETTNLTQGDILFEDEQTIIAVEVLSCECMVIKPADMHEMASVCYEIGNKHLPLFFEDNCLLTPFEQPLFQLLSIQGYDVKCEKKKLLQQLKTTIAPHGHGQNIPLFPRIIQMTGNE